MQGQENPKVQVAHIKQEQKDQFYKYSPQSTKPHMKIKKQTRRRSQTKIIHNCIIFECSGSNVERRVVSQAVFNVLTKKMDNLQEIVREIVRKSDAKAIDEYFQEGSTQKYRPRNDHCEVKVQNCDAGSPLGKWKAN